MMRKSLYTSNFEERIKRIAASLVTAAILFVSIYGTVSFFDNKQAHAKYDDFFDDPEDIDVIVLGSSHSIMSVLPMELWDEFHITSYNFSDYGQGIPIDYWVLQEVLQYRTPKLVILDTFLLEDDEKYSEKHKKYIHNSFDAFPISVVKYQAINDLFSPERRFDYLFPFSVYHSKWDSIDEEYFARNTSESSYANGSDESSLIATPSKDSLVFPVNDGGRNDLTEMNDIEATGKEYLIRIIELCQEKGIDILLATTPYVANEEYMRANNAVYPIAEQYGVRFYNGLVDDCIYYPTDMYDYGHLNSSGARKWTHALGEYVMSNYDLPTYEAGPIYDKWTGKYNEQYMNQKIGLATSRDSLKDYLMLIADRNISACIYFEDLSEIGDIEEIEDLLANLVGFQSLSLFEDSKQNKKSYMLIVDNMTNQISEVQDITEMDEIETSLGRVSFKNHRMVVNDSDENPDESDDGSIVPDVQVALINVKSGQVADVSGFTCLLKRAEMK